MDYVGRPNRRICAALFALGKVILGFQCPLEREEDRWNTA
jgi:hypothetical protein